MMSKYTACRKNEAITQEADPIPIGDYQTFIDNKNIIAAYAEGNERKENIKRAIARARNPSYRLGPKPHIHIGHKVHFPANNSISWIRLNYCKLYFEHWSFEIHCAKGR